MENPAGGGAGYVLTSSGKLWVPCSGAIIASLDQLVETAHCNWVLDPRPMMKKPFGTFNQRAPALMVKVETLQADGAYHTLCIC